MFYLVTKGYIITEDGELIPIDNDVVGVRGPKMDSQTWKDTTMTPRKM